MNGIDISNWQNGIKPANISCDFIICKATEGTGYTSPDFARQARETVASGKLLGCYHYASGGNAEKEAQHFLDVVGDYVGSAILCLDWESTNNASYSQHASWCKKWLEYVHQKTGVRAFIYISAGLRGKFSELTKTYPLWAAQYADYSKVNGFVSSPWNEGAYSCKIRQYTSMLYIDGWKSHLDADKAYITADEWKAYAAGDRKTEKETETETETVTASDFITTTALDVIAGKYGNGEARKTALGEYFYKLVQGKVNEMLGA